MEGFVGVVTLFASVLIGFTSASSLLFSMRDVYSELNAYGHVYVGRHADQDTWSASQDDPASIFVQLLDVRFLDSNGQVIHEANIGKVPVPYEYDFEERSGKTVLFIFHTSEYEDYQNIAALGRQMTTVFPEPKIQMTLGVFIFMRPGVLNKGSTLEQRVERGQVRLELELARTDTCPDCQQVAEVELDLWIRGQGPVSQVTERGQQYFTSYNMGSQSLLTIPLQVTSNGSPREISVDSQGEDRAIDLKLKTPLPEDTSPVLFSMTIEPAIIPEPVTESADIEEYMDQQPNNSDENGENSVSTGQQQEIKDTENSASLLRSSTVILCLTFITLQLRKCLL